MPTETPDTPVTIWPSETTIRATAAGLCRLDHGRFEGSCDHCRTTARMVLVRVKREVATREAAAEQRGAEQALRDAFAFMDRLFEIRPVESEFSKGFAYAMSGVLKHLDERAEAARAATADGGAS